MSGSSFLASFLGSFEGTVSVLLTLSVGFVVAQRGMVDHQTVHRISSLCTKIFLPCLIVAQMGPELTVKNLGRMWIIPAWGLVSTVIAHLLGWLAQSVFRTRSWLIVAAGRPNSSALPLLLLESLSSTGVLEALSNDGESPSQTLSRAKSLILLNVVIQQTITFQVAPSLLERDVQRDEGDGGAEDDAESGTSSTLTPSGKHASHIAPIIQDTEHVGLLQDHDTRSYGTSEEQGPSFPDALKPIANKPDIHWPEKLLFLKKPLERVVFSMSPALIGALVALFIGVSADHRRKCQILTAYFMQLIPPLNHLFFDEGSVLYTSVTQSAKEIGNLLCV